MKKKKISVLLAWLGWFCLVSTLVFGVCWEMKFLLNSVFDNPDVVNPSEAFTDKDLLENVKLILGMGLYGMGIWALLLFVTVPIAFLIMFVWSHLVSIFPRLEKERWPMMVGLLGAAFFGTLLRKVGLNFSFLFSSPLYFFQPSIFASMELVAFWVGLLLPRLMFSYLRPGVLLPTNQPSSSSSI